MLPFIDEQSEAGGKKQPREQGLRQGLQGRDEGGRRDRVPHLGPRLFRTQLQVHLILSTYTYIYLSIYIYILLFYLVIYLHIYLSIQI